jgi:hypothetical protein
VKLAGDASPGRPAEGLFNIDAAGVAAAITAHAGGDAGDLYGATADRPRCASSVPSAACC